jgi:MoaD family protein
MHVSFLGAIREITGTRGQSARASTVRDLLSLLLHKYGPRWQTRVFDGDGLAAGVVVMVNGTNVDSLRGLSTPLSPGDRIDLLSMFEGG